MTKKDKGIKTFQDLTKEMKDGIKVTIEFLHTLDKRIDAWIQTNPPWEEEEPKDKGKDKKSKDKGKKDKKKNVQLTDLDHKQLLSLALYLEIDKKKNLKDLSEKKLLKRIEKEGDENYFEEGILQILEQ